MRQQDDQDCRIIARDIFSGLVSTGATWPLLAWLTHHNPQAVRWVWTFGGPGACLCSLSFGHPLAVPARLRSYEPSQAVRTTPGLLTTYCHHGAAVPEPVQAASKDCKDMIAEAIRS